LGWGEVGEGVCWTLLLLLLLLLLPLPRPLLEQLVLL
jgi:hypothetical protein